jgi:predicted ATPase
MTRRHLERIDWAPRPGVDTTRWPFTLPAVRALIDGGGVEVPAGVTFLVGENGSGKSTLVEAFAAVYPRSGVENPFVNVVGARPATEDSPLRWHLRAQTHPLASPAGFFLRSETLHDYLTEVDSTSAGAAAFDGATLTARSHGEAVLAVLRHRFTEPGVYFLDEPEAALSFTSQLALVAVLAELAAAGCQVIAATHSPLVTALPGATLLEIGDHGIRTTNWSELGLVDDWRAYLAAPDRYLRHLIEEHP